MPVKINTTIPQEKYQEIKDLNVNLNHLLLLGLDSFKNNPKILDRVRENEERIERLERRMRANHNKVIDLITEIKEVRLKDESSKND